MTNNSLQISPGMGVYNMFKHLKYKSWFAIAEFIDNSIQSFIKKDGKYGETRNICRIKIVYEPNEDYLCIEDNAYGISDIEHQRAFTAGVPPADTSGLSEFGIGMKSAGIWFSPYWTVKTQSIDSDLEYQYIFDLKKLIETDGILEPLIGKRSDEKGYTKIELHQLNNKLRSNTLKKIKLHLASIYRVFLRKNELEIIFNGEKLEYQETEILNAKKAWVEEDNDNNKIIEWKKTISFSLSNKGTVNGFVAIRKEGSYRHAGLSLFRRKRLIQGSDEEKYKPYEIFKGPNTFMSSRIFGELFLEGFEVSHTKDAFNFGEYEEEFLEILEKNMNSEPLPIIKQSLKYTVKKSSTKTVNSLVKITTAATQNISENIQETASTIKQASEPKGILNKIADVITDDKDKFNSNIETKTVPSSVESQKISLEMQNLTKSSFTQSGIKWNISYGLTDNKDTGLYKIEYNDDQSRRPDSKEKNITIKIYKDHPLILRVGNENQQSLQLLAQILITLSLAEVTLIADGERWVHLLRKSFNSLIGTVISKTEK